MLTEMGVMPEHQGSLSPPLLQYRTFEFAGWRPRGATHTHTHPFNLAENRKWSRRTSVKVIIAASWLYLYTSRMKQVHHVIKQPAVIYKYGVVFLWQDRWLRFWRGDGL